jgi:hypothetical protein
MVAGSEAVAAATSLGGKALRPVHKCARYECGKHYHEECLSKLGVAVGSLCPLHICTMCRKQVMHAPFIFVTAHLLPGCSVRPSLGTWQPPLTPNAYGV